MRKFIIWLLNLLGIVLLLLIGYIILINHTHAPIPSNQQIVIDALNRVFSIVHGDLFGLPFLLVVLIAVIVAGLLLLQYVDRRGRRRRAPRRARTSGVRRAFRRIDHGAAVARQHGHQRSPQWPRVEKEHLLHEPACVACGHKGKGLQVHHIKPFHLHPQLELDSQNLITLCEIKGRDHHLLLGHLDEWESHNVHVRDDVRRFYGKTALQIRADQNWLKKVKLRP